MKLFEKYALRRQNRDGAILVILAVVVLVSLWPLIADKKDGTAVTIKYKAPYKSGRYYAQQGINDGASPAISNCELFEFDPNIADSTALLKLGLKPWQVRSIYKYRSKGGRFRTKEDFARLYGLTLEKYRQLEPYIMIHQEVMAADVVKPRKYSKNDHRYDLEHQVTTNPSVPHRIKLRPGQKVDINVADTAELQRIPGIGPYFAQRIVDMRIRRKAFVSPEELVSCIRNFPEIALPYMVASQNFPSIHINKVQQKELAAHPLLNYTQARDIIALRRQTGNIGGVKDLSVLPSLNAEQLKRLAPFLLFD